MNRLQNTVAWLYSIPTCMYLQLISSPARHGHTTQHTTWHEHLYSAHVLALVLCMQAEMNTLLSTQAGMVACTQHTDWHEYFTQHTGQHKHLYPTRGLAWKDSPKIQSYSNKICIWASLK